MSRSTQQEQIKRKLHSFDIQQSHSRAAQLKESLRNNSFQLLKYHSFRQISDWNDRYSIDKALIFHQKSEKSEKYQQLPEFYRYARLIYPQKQGNLIQSRSVSLKKERCHLSPFKVEFLNSNSKKRSKKQASFFNNQEADQMKKTKYEVKYEPLRMLYQLKTKKDGQKRVQSSQKQIPILFPEKQSSIKLPKTERNSSIFRVMKKNHQIRQIRRKNNPQKAQLEMFVIPT